MALTRTLLTAGGDTTNGNVYTTASITPGANRLILLAVQLDPAGSGVTPTITGCGLTWVLIARNIVANSTRTVLLFRARGAAPTTGPVTIDAGALQDGCIWFVVEYNGADTSGTNGSGAIVQVMDAEGVETAVTSVDLPFGAPVDPANETFAIVGQSTGAAQTAGTGWTQLSYQGIATPTQAAASQYANPAQQNVRASFGASTNAFVAAVEVKAGVSAAAAAFSGSGTLSATPTPAVSRAAALSGTGSLSAAPRPAVTRPAALSGTGTLTAAAAPGWTSAAALSGSGTLTAAARPSFTRAATLSGSGTLTAGVFGYVTPQLSGSGTLTATVRPAWTLAAALSGVGTLTATVRPAVIRAAALSGTGSLTATARGALLTAGALSGSGTLTALAIARYRFAVWTGTLWRPLRPQVLTPSGWRSDVPVNLKPSPEGS